MRTAAEILERANIRDLKPANDDPTRFYALCPQCSSGRQPDHQKLRCLGVTITDVGVKFGCNHCHWKGGEFYEPRNGNRGGKRNGGGSPFVAEYIYRQADGTPYLKVCKTADKQFPQFHWNETKWVKGKPRGPKIPYRLPELIAASADAIVHVYEGEKDADNAAKRGFVATSASEGAGKWKPELNPWFKDRHVVIFPDADAPGREHAQKVARALQPVAASIKVVDLYPDRNDGSDVSDWLKMDSTGESLLKLIDDAPPWNPNADSAKASSAGSDEEKIAELAQLSELAYQKCRVAEATKLDIRVGELDKLVKKQRAQAIEDTEALPHWVVEPWNVAVDAAELLDDIKQMFRRYIVLPQGADIAIALWVLHAWTFDAGDISPFLVLVSPTKRCGKTNTLIVLQYLTPRSEMASNISPSAVFRRVQDLQPTLLFDEADSFLRNEEMRGILDSGHTKPAAYVIRNVEVDGQFRAKRFSTWAPKAIATIGSLKDTLEDRSIIIALQRKPKTAEVTRLRKRDNEEFARLRGRAARWAQDNFAKLTDPDPDIPDALNDRAADNWRPLLAIAELAGADWLKRARDAACLLSGEGHESTSRNVELLAHIREAFGDLDVITSAKLVEKLTADPERPWADWKHGKPLTQRQLAILLRPFGIISETVHPLGQPDAKGYQRARFKEAWTGYLSGQNDARGQFGHSDPSKRPNADGIGTTHDFSIRPKGIPDGSKNAELSNNDAGLDAWTDRKAGHGRVHESDQEIAPSPPCSPDLDEDRTCAQCHGLVDGKEQLVSIGGADTVWLHPECKRFYLSANSPKPAPAEAELCARCGKPGNTLNNSLMRDRRGRLVHRTCRDETNWTVPQGRSLN
jgi:putative DNA primase/helicase